jgi:hypothetical protein
LESNLAGAGDGGEQETGIQVDLDGKDGGTVSRARPRATAKPKSWAEASNDKSKDVKRRIARIEGRFNQQLAEQEARHQRQIQDLTDRVNKPAKGDQVDTDEAAHETAMAKLQQDLEDAQERGDSKAVAAISRAMSVAEGKYWAARTTKQTQGASENATREAAARAATAAKGSERQPTKAGVAWAKLNAEWWNDTVDETACDARSYANTVHKRMLDEGEGDPETPEYFERIGAMVRKRFPEIEVKSAGGKRRPAADPDDDDSVPGDDPDAVDTQQRRAPARLPDRGEAPRGSRLAHLTQADIRTMREVNLDPNNNKHVLEFVKSKREVEEAE